jgi:hypothetical protein
MERWDDLIRYVNNGPPRFGAEGVRDPENPCVDFDARGYQGDGRCLSDGHYMCDECSHLSPDAPRFHQHGRDGRRDRLRLFWRRWRKR